MGKLSNEQMLCGAVILVLVYLIFRGKTTEGAPRRPRGPSIKQTWNNKLKRPEYIYISSGRRTSRYWYERDQARVRREQARWKRSLYGSSKSSRGGAKKAREKVRKKVRKLFNNPVWAARFKKAAKQAVADQALSDKQAKAKGGWKK